MVHQHFTLADNLTVLDNIVLGTQSNWLPWSGSSTARKRIRQLGEEFGLAVDPDAVVSSLSVGERQRVEILKALYREARILILDEPTAVLTPQESEALFRTLKIFVEKGLSIIFISHKLNEILAACHRVVVLRGGKMVAERAVAGASKEDLAELMVGRAVPAPKAAPAELRRPVLEMRKVQHRKGGQRLDNADLIVFGGEVVGVAGVSGNGKACWLISYQVLWYPSAAASQLARSRPGTSPRATWSIWAWPAFRKTAMPKVSSAICRSWRM